MTGPFGSWKRTGACGPTHHLNLVLSLPQLADTLRRLCLLSPAALAFFSHTVRGEDTCWLLETFSPLFDCDDVSDDWGEVTEGLQQQNSSDGDAGVAGRTEGAVPATADRQTLIFRLRPKTGGGLLESYDVDEDEAAAAAEYAAARQRLGLR